MAEMALRGGEQYEQSQRNLHSLRVMWEALPEEHQREDGVGANSPHFDFFVIFL